MRQRITHQPLARIHQIIILNIRQLICHINSLSHLILQLFITQVRCLWCGHLC